MIFNSDASSYSETRKLKSDLTVRQLPLRLEMRSSKRLTKNDTFLTAVTAIERKRESQLKWFYRSIELVFNYLKQVYDIILSLAKCSLSVGDEKEKEEESELLKLRYVYSLISLNWMTLICSQSKQLILSPSHVIQIYIISLRSEPTT